MDPKAWQHVVSTKNIKKPGQQDCVRHGVRLQLRNGEVHEQHLLQACVGSNPSTETALA